MRIVIFLSVLLLSSNPAAAVEAVDVDVASTHACVLYDDGAVYCWGDPTSEDLPPFTAQRVAGLPPATAISVGGFGAACAVAGYGDLWCWGVDVQRSLRAREFVQKKSPFRVEGLPEVMAVDLGFAHMCAVSEDGEVWCWGKSMRRDRLRR